MKNQFNGKSGEDIWSSLILSLPAEEVSKMAPRDQINSRGAGEGEEEEEEVVESKSEPESETVEDEAVEKDFEEEEMPVELVRLEAAAPKGGKMSKTKTVKDLSQEYDKFARWVIQHSTEYPTKSMSVVSISVFMWMIQQYIHLTVRHYIISISAICQRWS